MDRQAKKIVVDHSGDFFVPENFVYKSKRGLNFLLSREVALILQHGFHRGRLVKNLKGV